MQDAIAAINRVLEEGDTSFTSEVIGILNARREIIQQILRLQSRLNYLLAFYERNTQDQWRHDLNLFSDSEIKIKLVADRVRVEINGTNIVTDDVLIYGERRFSHPLSRNNRETLTRALEYLDFETLRGVILECMNVHNA